MIIYKNASILGRMSDARPSASLLPTLGLFTTTALVVGGIIGSGIFKNPASMAALVRSPEILLLVWIGAGIVTVFGALTNAEVTSIIPATGGQYHYFRTMYGDFTAYIYGWALFAVIQSGSIASITYVFSYYFHTLWPLPEFSPDVATSVALRLPFGTIYPLQEIGIKLLTCGMVILLTVVNYLGVREGGRVQGFFTVAKVAAILFLVFCAFAFGNGSVTHFTLDATTGPPVGMALIAAVVLTMNKALWAYDGWNNITYVAGEIRQPQRTIPTALMIGTGTVIVVYILINLAYLYVMPIDQMATSESVAADTALRSVGAWGLTFVSIAVMIATLGTSNGTILVSSRVYYAMAKEKMFFRSVGHVHPRYHTPSRSLVWQCVWTCVLIFTGTFDMLTEMLIFVSWAFYALGAYGVFILRKRMPDAPRPYKVWGYPYVPIIFIAFALVFLVFSIWADVDNYNTRSALGEEPILNTVYGAVLLLTGVPFYWLFKRSRTSDQA